MTSKYIGWRSSGPKMATPGPPRAEKLIFSDKTLACSNDSSPILRYKTPVNCGQSSCVRSTELGNLNISSRSWSWTRTDSLSTGWRLTLPITSLAGCSGRALHDKALPHAGVDGACALDLHRSKQGNLRSATIITAWFCKNWHLAKSNIIKYLNI